MTSGMAGPARRTTWPILTGLAILLATAAGCAAGDAVPEPSDRELPDVRTIDELPLNAYTLDLDELVTVHEATWLLAGRCAARFGVEELDVPDPDASVVIGMNPRRYGLVSREDAEHHGYRPAGPGGQTDAAPVAEWSPTRAEVIVLTGGLPDGSPLPTASRPEDGRGSALPDGGCLEEASRVLTDGARVDRQLVEELAHVSFQRAESDPVVRAAWADWSACMDGRGFRYSSPWEANDAGWGDALTEPERRAATADALCRESTGLTSTWAAVEAWHQLDLMDAHQQELRLLARAVEHRMEAARRVLRDDHAGGR